MGFFDHLQRKPVSAIKPQGPVIRTVDEGRRTAKKQKVVSARPRLSSASTSAAAQHPQHHSQSHTPGTSNGVENGKARSASSIAAPTPGGAGGRGLAARSAARLPRASASAPTSPTSSRAASHHVQSPATTANAINGARKIPVRTKTATATATARPALVNRSASSPRISDLRHAAASSAASDRRRGPTRTVSSAAASRKASSASLSATRKRQLLAEQPLSSDSSDDEGSSDIDMLLEMRRRAKTSVSASVEPDLERTIKMAAAFAEGDAGLGGVVGGGDNDGVAETVNVHEQALALRRLEYVHAADITPAEDFSAAFRSGQSGQSRGATAARRDDGSEASISAVHASRPPPSPASSSSATVKPPPPATATATPFRTVELQYPSICPREKYTLAVPHEADGFQPIDDIVRTVETIAENYIPSEHMPAFSDPTTGLLRRLRRALAHTSQSEFEAALADYNTTIADLRRSGAISTHLDKTMRSLPLPLVERILTQIYARTVSPRVDSLRRYENGTDNVYGELLPRFVTEIFAQTRLRSGQVFVDLGSGVGNVALQAALECGCEAWGCEVMSNACDLAELQAREFDARCALWGIQPGTVHLVRGDFLKEESIMAVLRRADVVLINNQAFTPQLNDNITNLFLDMKEGVQIVSLKPFVPAGHKITARNLNNPINLLSVKRFEYWSEYVSWTDAGGEYFIATKDSAALRRFAERM
ncbi:Nucleosomal histone H3-Lys79 methylase [Ascosphaera acerosa]|nr:Nucleosomal histone H3-Lys79 methylase [Ascosphaera acerosa]